MNAWLWLVLATLTALSLWANHALQQPLPTAQKRNFGADHSFIQPEARVFTKDGDVAYDIRGAHLQHRAESGEYLLSQARMLVYPQNQPDTAPSAQREHWHIQSAQAKILADREHVLLEGQVDAERQGVPAEKRITLRAQNVTLARQAQTASSAHPVTVQGANWQSQSSAFHADLTTKQLEQTGRVHDRYQPID
ncbi:MAG: LPS export ABC transporter periplasmic protein LptC [Pseudomonadota bacterium]